MESKGGAQGKPVGAPLPQHAFLVLLRALALICVGQLTLLQEGPDVDQQAG